MSVLKVVENEGKWLINVNEGLDARKATPDTRTSLQSFNAVSERSLCFQLKERVRNSLYTN